MSGLPNDYSGLPNDYSGLPNDYLGLPNDYLGLPNDYSGLPNDSKLSLTWLGGMTHKNISSRWQCFCLVSIRYGNALVQERTSRSLRIEQFKITVLSVPVIKETKINVFMSLL